MVGGDEAISGSRIEEASELGAALKRSEKRREELEERVEDLLEERQIEPWYHSKFASSVASGILKIGAVYVFLWGCYTFFQPQVDKVVDSIPPAIESVTQTMHEWHELSESRLTVDETKIRAGYVVETTSKDSYGNQTLRIERVGPAARNSK